MQMACACTCGGASYLVWLLSFLSVFSFTGLCRCVRTQHTQPHRAARLPSVGVYAQDWNQKAHTPLELKTSLFFQKQNQKPPSSSSSSNNTVDPSRRSLKPAPSHSNTQSSLPQPSAGQVDVGLGQWRGAPTRGSPTAATGGTAFVVAVVTLLFRLRFFPLLDLWIYINKYIHA